LLTSGEHTRSGARAGGILAMEEAAGLGELFLAARGWRVLLRESRQGSNRRYGARTDDGTDHQTG